MAPRQRLAQLHFGREAAFGVCAEPACPQLTRKTLAVAAAVAQPVALREPQPPALVPTPISDAALSVSLPRAGETSAPSEQTDVAIARTVVNFPFASAALTSAARATLATAIRYARTSERIVISGRTDAVGDVESNEALALARALAVRNHFRDIAPDLAATIAIDAKGRCCFVASNADDAGRSKNRRVEIVFTSRGGA
jgi:outer membrane protein OmpA-like peptidoglycan-associated protein